MSTLSALGRRGERLEAFCPNCGQSLGWYEVTDKGDGCIALYDPAAAIRAAPNLIRRSDGHRRTGARGRRTGARRVTYEVFESTTRLRWRCGCGADIIHRSDRIGQLEATWTNGRFTVEL